MAAQLGLRATDEPGDRAVARISAGRGFGGEARVRRAVAGAEVGGSEAEELSAKRARDLHAASRKANLVLHEQGVATLRHVHGRVVRRVLRKRGVEVGLLFEFVSCRDQMVPSELQIRRRVQRMNVAVEFRFRCDARLETDAERPVLERPSREQTVIGERVAEPAERPLLEAHGGGQELHFASVVRIVGRGNEGRSPRVELVDGNAPLEAFELRVRQRRGVDDSRRWHHANDLRRLVDVQRCVDSIDSGRQSRRWCGLEANLTLNAGVACFVVAVDAFRDIQTRQAQAVGDAVGVESSRNPRTTPKRAP